MTCDSPAIGGDYEGYSYDANSNRTQVRLRSTTSTQTDTIGYSYDALNRETFRDIANTSATDVSTRYDLQAPRARALRHRRDAQYGLHIHQ